MLKPEAFGSVRSYLPKDGAVIGLWGFTYEINSGSTLGEGIVGRIARVAFKYQRNVSTGDSVELEGNRAKKPSEADQWSPFYGESGA